ncbi:MAG: beta-lactamase family protein [Actinobacteria bacterium]|nr:MAG: beta-lactamase family protein [Actinomycetota bacterium]
MGRGVTTEGKAGLHAALAAHVGSGAMPGLVALVRCGDDVHVEAIGHKDFGDAEPIGLDAIFRIASITKPMTAATLMLLVEDGMVGLDDIVDGWLPELCDRRVLRSIDAELDDTVPAARPITVEDVLSFRLGYGSIMAPPGTYPIQRAEAALDLKTFSAPWPPPELTPDQWIASLGSLPLLHQPGAQWMYNTGAEVAGVLIERIAGAPLDDVMRERLFEPLDMVDTGFFVPADKRHRFTTQYAPDPETGALGLLDPVEGWWAAAPKMPNGAGWLVSTVDDVAAFAAMMAAGGGELLSAETMRLMITDRTTAVDRAANTVFLGGHSGWGLGMAVPAADGASGVPGGYGWDGGTGTSWRNDPATGLTGILLTQRAMTSPEPPAVFDDFWRHAYAAIAD